MKRKSISLIFLIIFTVNLFFSNYTFANNVVNQEANAEDVKVKKDIFTDIPAPNLLIAETKTGKILYERKADEKIYPASVTKLLTAILVVEIEAVRSGK